LTYTRFAYSDLTLSQHSIQAGNSIQLKVKVKNTGSLAAEEVVQLYLTDVEASVELPQYALKEFERLQLTPGETKTVEMTIDPKMMEMVNADGQSLLEAGNFKVFIGGAVPSQRSLDLGATPHLEATFEVKK
jgi:CARDB.